MRSPTAGCSALTHCWLQCAHPLLAAVRSPTAGCSTLTHCWLQCANPLLAAVRSLTHCWLQCAHPLLAAVRSLTHCWLAHCWLQCAHSPTAGCSALTPTTGTTGHCSAHPLLAGDLGTSWYYTYYYTYFYYRNLGTTFIAGCSAQPQATAGCSAHPLLAGAHPHCWLALTPTAGTTGHCSAHPLLVLHLLLHLFLLPQSRYYIHFYCHTLGTSAHPRATAGCSAHPLLVLHLFLLPHSRYYIHFYYHTLGTSAHPRATAVTAGWCAHPLLAAAHRHCWLQRSPTAGWRSPTAGTTLIFITTHYTYFYYRTLGIY